MLIAVRISVSSNSNSSDTVNNCSDCNNDSCGFPNSNNVTSCVASCNGVNNDISSGDNICSYVSSDNTTSIIVNGSDNICVASRNSNSSSVDSCKNVNSVAIDNASSSYCNHSSIISNIACQTFPDDNVPTNVNDKMVVSNFNDNMGNLENDNDCAFTWDDVVAMKDVAKDLEEVPAPASHPLVCPSKARTARRSDRLQQSFIPRRLTRASTKSKS